MVINLVSFIRYQQNGRGKQRLQTQLPNFNAGWKHGKNPARFLGCPLRLFNQKLYPYYVISGSQSRTTMLGILSCFAAGQLAVDSPTPKRNLARQVALSHTTPVNTSL